MVAPSLLASVPWWVGVSWRVGKHFAIDMSWWVALPWWAGASPYQRYGRCLRAGDFRAGVLVGQVVVCASSAVAEQASSGGVRSPEVEEGADHVEGLD